MTPGSVAKLRSLIGDANVCMLTTVDKDGSLRSRPMAMQQADFDGNLWFFTGRHSELGSDLEAEQRVNINVARADSGVYISVSGRGEFVEDPAKARRLWSNAYRAWFPKGLDDPDLQLMKVEVEKAEYWESPNSAVVPIYSAIKAGLSEEREPIGEHGKFQA